MAQKHDIGKVCLYRHTEDQKTKSFGGQSLPNRLLALTLCKIREPDFVDGKYWFLGNGKDTHLYKN